MKKKNELPEEDFDLDDEGIYEEDVPPHNELDDENLLGNDDMFAGDYGSDMGFYGDMGSPVPMEKHKDLLKELTNFKPYIRDTINNWLGLVWDEDQGKYVKCEFIKPIMNIKGAMWCAGFLKTYTRENNIITDISSEHFKFMVSDIIDTIWFNLGTRDDLGIKEDGDLLRVATEMQHAAELVLMGAGDGRYNKFLGTTYSHNTSGVVNPGGNPININTSPNLPPKSVGGRIRSMLFGNKQQQQMN